MKNEALIRNFIQGENNQKNQSLTNQDNKLYSYNLLIADRDKWEIYKTNYSKTTTTHINKLIYLATGYNIISR